MPYLRRISERHQVTIPPILLKQAGVSEGTLFSINRDRNRIILEPIELTSKDWTKEDWDQMDKLLKKQLQAKEFREYPNPQEAKKHLTRFSKKS